MAKLVQLKDKDGLIYPSVIVKTTVNNNGTAIQYSDGTMICYGIKTYSNQVCNTDYWSFTNRTPENLNCDFPVAFISKPVVQMTYRCSVSGAIGLYKTSDTTNSNTGNFGITIAKSSTANRDIVLDYIAIGKWR